MKHVLLADDDAPTRHSLRRALEAAGYRVTEATDGQEALERLLDGLPDAVVLDVMMPRLDGFEVLRTLQDLPGGPDLPVIMLTARPADDSPILGWWRSYLDYVVKPLEPREVTGKLEWFFRTGEPPPIVLIADDDWPVLKPTTDALRSHGLRVIPVQDGREALGWITEHHPALVILDAVMPWMDGFEVLKQLRANPEIAATPVIMLLSRTAEVGYYRTWKIDVSYLVTKPFPPPALARLVYELLAGAVAPETVDRTVSGLEIYPRSD